MTDSDMAMRPYALALRRAVSRAMLVFFAAAVTMLVGEQIMGQVGWRMSTDPTIMSTDPTIPYRGWILTAVMLLAACWGFLLRGRRLVTTDVTTFVPATGRWGLLGLLVLAMLATQAVAGLLSGVLSVFGLDFTAPEQQVTAPLLPSLGGVLYMTLFVPILEEVIFRGALLRHLVPYGANFAIVTQAVAFGLWHYNLLQGLFAFAVGLIFGYVALRFSIKWTILMHIVNNSLVVVPIFWPDAALLMGIVILYFAALVVVVILAILRRQKCRALIGEGRSTFARPFRTAWSHPVFIAVVAIGLAYCAWVSVTTAMAG